MEKRALGFEETLRYYLHQAGHASMVMCLQIEGDTSEQAIRQALELVFNKHPLLRSRVIEESGGLFYHCDLDISDLPIRFHVLTSEYDIKKKRVDIANTHIDLSKYSWTFDVFNYGRTWEFVAHLGVQLV